MLLLSCLWLLFRPISANEFFIMSFEVSLQVIDHNVFDIFLDYTSLNSFSILKRVLLSSLKKTVQMNSISQYLWQRDFICTTRAIKVVNHIQLDITCTYLTFKLNYREHFRDIFSCFCKTKYIFPNKIYPPITRIY